MKKFFWKCKINNLRLIILTCIRDDKYFGNLNLINNDLETTLQYNLSTIYKQIVYFYKEEIEIEFEDNFFNPKDNKDSNFRKLAELITGMAAQCDKREYFLQIMQNMENKDSTELFTILTERITAYTKEMRIDEFKKNDESEEDEQTAFFLRIESLEIENYKLQDELKNANEKIADLTKENYTNELNMKEMEGKYQELLNSFENRNSDSFQKNDLEEHVNLSIQLSELKGKLEAREKNIQKLKEEKEKIIDDYKNKLLNLQKETEILREKSIKYDVLKEKMHSLDEINNLKSKIMQNERIIKDQDEKIKKLKNYDVDKSILLKKIEELNFELSQEREKMSDIIKENSYYKDLIIQSENDIKFLKKQTEALKNSQSDSVTLNALEVSSEKITPLSELEDHANLKKTILELETKIKLNNTDRENFNKEKSELEEKIAQLNQKLEENQKEMDKFMKKESKYIKYKEEKHTFITKISDIMEKLHEARSENENLRFQKSKELTETETNYNNNLNSLTQKHNEEIFSLKEVINKLENENNYMSKEIKRAEELNESNKLYIEELQKKINNPQSDSKLMEFEYKLKEFAANENVELKRKITDKDEQITKLSEKLKNYDSKMKECTHEIEKLKKLSEEISIEELKKRDEAISYYKNRLEAKEKLYNEELQITSSLLHQLGLEYCILQTKMNNGGDGPLNFNIDKL